MRCVQPGIPFTLWTGQALYRSKRGLYAILAPVVAIRLPVYAIRGVYAAWSKRAVARPKETRKSPSRDEPVMERERACDKPRDYAAFISK